MNQPGYADCSAASLMELDFPKPRAGKTLLCPVTLELYVIHARGQDE